DGCYGEARVDQLRGGFHRVDAKFDLLDSHGKFDEIAGDGAAGANSTRVNFFLVAAPNSAKVLIELFESPSA
ncbi:MAG: hypothetical protein WAL86_09505, partial [Candidatus Acidiferrales bacterium]